MLHDICLTPFDDPLLFALIGLVTGAFVGLARVLALAVGKWLRRES